jgi:hypothetical protein
MTRIMGGALALLVLLPAVQAREGPKPADQVKALTAEFQKAQTEFQKALAGVKTPQERQKIVDEKMPKRDDYSKRFLEIAQKNPKDPAAVDALVWVLENTSPYGTDTTHSKALELLRRDHLQSENLAKVFAVLSRGYDKASMDLATLAMEKNPHREVQARVCVMMAERLQGKLKLQQRFKDNPSMAQNYERVLGEGAVEEIKKTDPEKAAKEVEKLYERIAADYKDVADSQYGTLGKLAQTKLNGLHNPIVVDKPAPDIEGADVDGKSFKLSDYRGKVVLLDFWGHW